MVNWLYKQMGISFLHNLLRFPDVLFNLLVSPYHFDGDNLLISQHTNLSIKDGDRNLFIGQAIINFNKLHRDNEQPITNHFFNINT